MDEIYLLPEHYEEVSTPQTPVSEADSGVPLLVDAGQDAALTPPLEVNTAAWLPPTVHSIPGIEWAVQVPPPVSADSGNPAALGGVAARGSGTIVRLATPSRSATPSQPVSPPLSATPSPNRKRPKSHWIKTTWLRRTLKITVTAIFLVAVAAGGLVGYAYYRYSQVKKVSIPAIVPVNTAINPGENILLVGSDTLPPPTTGTTTGTSAGNVGAPSHADVIMVFHLDLSSGTASVLSIPPQLAVSPTGQMGTGSSQETLDDLFGRGPASLVEAITQLFDIPVNHYVGIDYAGIEGMVSEVGGVKLRFDYPVRDPYSGLSIEHTGCSILGGSQSLALLRSVDYQYQAGFTWTTDTTGSYGVAQRQRTFLGALGAKSVASGVTNPLTGNRFVGSLADDVTLDSTFSFTDLFSLVDQVSSDNLAHSTTYTFDTFPISGPDQSIELGYDPAGARQVVLKFLGASVGTQGPPPIPVPGTSTTSIPGSGNPGSDTGGLGTGGAAGTTITSVPGQAAQPTFFDPRTC